jgi:hypothetical protein
MSKYNLERALRRELAGLNEVIDRKIVRGLSYSKEAKRHKAVLKSLSMLRQSGWFARPFSSFSIV